VAGFYEFQDLQERRTGEIKFEYATSCCVGAHSRARLGVGLTHLTDPVSTLVIPAKRSSSRNPGCISRKDVLDSCPTHDPPE
jgi:hypothetical protein